MLELKEEMRVNILQDGKKVDEAIVRRVGIGGDPPTEEIQIESLRLYPGDRKEFAFIRIGQIQIGWRMLFREPMTNARCYSQLAPTFTFEPIL
jgi:hypothetical protein